MSNKKKKKEEEWKKELTPEQYNVLRLKGTEKPFTGKYWDNEKEGIYKCAGCGTLLFDSNTKFDAGCGWPSFSSTIKEANIEEKVDKSQNMVRTEVLCKNCGGHLGHIFDDGPQPTGLRFCINSVSIDFEKKDE